ncbi:MAG TPA: hypothetical protein VEV61_04105, partial [Streptosporangiaceae bacterium]|nr:hypothetical protein [Streptosporangiaceae bacterium]
GANTHHDSRGGGHNGPGPTDDLGVVRHSGRLRMVFAEAGYPAGGLVRYGAVAPYDTHSLAALATRLETYHGPRTSM